jgi:phosphoesterase RecJ-like protein
MNQKYIEKLKQIEKYIDESSNILLHCHPYPDPDSIGSVLAMKEYLEGEGKNVTAIVGDSGYPENLKSLDIEKKVIDSNFFDIDNKEFDLFLILDSSSKSQISRIDEVVFPDSMKTVVIDHHKTNTAFGDINLIISEFSSTSQIIYELFKYWEVDISEDMALYLFLGIFADTGGFKYLNTTPEVLLAASELANIYPNYHKIVFDFENSKKPIEIEMMALALSSINKHMNDRVVFTAIPFKEIKARGLTKELAIEGLVPGILRSVLGWDIVGSLVEVEEGKTVVSLRTRDEEKYDVSKIASKVGENGGGHPGAAGTTIMMKAEDAEKELLKMIEKLYGNEL